MAKLSSTKYNKFQTNILSADVTSDGVISDLTFNNLVIGKYYEIKLQALLGVNQSGADQSVIVDVKHDGNLILRRLLVDIDSSTSTDQSGSSLIIQATATTLTFEANGGATANSPIFGNGTTNETFAQLIERNDLVETTDFT